MLFGQEPFLLEYALIYLTQHNQSMTQNNIPYTDDIDQQLHLRCFYPISCLFAITTITTSKKPET